MTKDALSEATDKLVRCIVDEVHPLRIILFGSAARGEFGPDSDIDVLVVMPEGTHRRRVAQHLYGTVRGVAIPFDFIVATPADIERHGDNPGLVYQSILKEGRTVYVG